MSSGFTKSSVLTGQDSLWLRQGHLPRCSGGDVPGPKQSQVVGE